MPDEYDDIVNAALGDSTPRRTRSGALKYQPPDSDWNLNRLGELKDFYQSTYNRPLPLAVVGQGSIHNKWGYDHRASADVSLDPRTTEGQALIGEMQRRNIPFLAFDRAIPGVATGPHIHVGRPSHKGGAKYGIGAQVKGAPKPDDYSDVIAAATGEGTADYNDVIEAAVTPPSRGRGMARAAKVPVRPRPQPPGLGNLRQLDEAAIQANKPSIADLRRTDEAVIREMKPTGVGQLRRIDEQNLNARKRIEADVRKERAFKSGIGMPQTLNPITAIGDYLAGRTEDEIVQAEVQSRLDAGAAEQTRLREIADQFTEEDKRQLAAAVQSMRAMGSGSRGAEIGAQRVGSGLLYKLAGLTEVATYLGPHKNLLGDYLRRQAARGELSIQEIESELPPDMRQELADFITTSVGSLPEIAGAVAAAGPIGGFAALGGLEAAGQKRSVGQILRETAKGATLGAVFQAAPLVERGGAQTLAQRAADTARSGTAIGLGTYGVEKLFGADDFEAARAAGANVLFHAGTRVAGEVGRYTQAAERALKTDVAEESTPTVSPATLGESAATTEASLKTPEVATDRRGPQRVPQADWLQLTPEERARIRGELAVEMEPPVETPPVAVEQGVLPFEQPVARAPLADLMRERMQRGPSEEYPGYTSEQVSNAIANKLEVFDAVKPNERIMFNGVDAYVVDRPTPDTLRIKVEGEQLFGLGGEAEVRTVTRAEMNDFEGPVINRLSDFIDTEATTTPPTTEAVPAATEAASPSAINILTGKPVKGKPSEGGYVRVDEIAKAIRRVHDNITGEKERSLGYVLTLPSGRELGIDFTVDRKGVAHLSMGPLDERGTIDVTGVEPVNLGVDTMLAIKRFLLQTHPEIKRIDAERAGSTGFKVGRKVNLNALPRTTPELPRAAEAPRRVDLETVREKLGQRGFLVREPEGTALPTFTVHDARGREVAKFASATRERAMEQLDNYASRSGSEGGFIDLTEIVAGLEELRRKFPDRTESELRDMLPPLHREAIENAHPRTDTGQFAPGPVGGLDAARTELRTAARKYAQQFKALDSHPARRNGLDIVSDDTASNYFDQLRRMAKEFLPSQAAAVDRAESLYNQGKYSEATMLTESVFQSLPDKTNEYAGADAAIQLTQRGLTAKSDWSKVLQEVRERLKRTGGLSGGGSTFYDVNKYPEGGRPDHAKIAYILEPVIDAIKADTSRLIAEGKLKAADYVDHIRREVNKMLAGEEFNDWHPLNKSAALGVLVDRLRTDGPPAARSAEPQQRQRSLPKTLEKSGREPGTNTTYERVPNVPTEQKVARRLAEEGAEALEQWYRDAPPSAERTAAFIQLVDHYEAKAVELSDTAPEAARRLHEHAIELDNLEAERATSIGQAEQMYSRLQKYNPVGVVREIAALKRRGVQVTEQQEAELSKQAVEHQQLDRQVKKLERKVATLEVETGEVEPPSSNEAPSRPRTYRPRTGAPDTPTERVRRQLDEAAKRRRAAKAAIASRLRQLEQQRTAAGYWKRSMNLTRGLMVSAFSTAMRNLQSQAIRFDVERLTDAIEHTLRRSVGLDSDLTYRNVWRNTARQFKFTQTAEAREILTNHPAELARMFNAYAGGIDVPIPSKARNALERTFQTAERGVEIANFFNRVQEFHVRSAEFLAEVDLHLRKEANLSLEKYVQRNGIDAIPQEIVKRGVDKALEVTFADMPLRDGAGGRLLTSLIEVGNYLPPTLSPAAFPRFMFNNIKFLYQYSPAGMIDLARKSQNRPRVVARSLVGTSMLLLAYQFRKSDHAGEKWYELRFGDTTVDARPFGPFSTYLFLAEAVRRQLNGEKAFTTEEIAGAIGATTGPGGTALSVAERLYDYAANGRWDKWQKVAKTEAGDWGRALLTPVRQIKDLIGAFDASQAINRDTSTEPALGPIRESIPYADMDLPPALKPTTATPIHQERPLTKAITGWRVETPKTFLEKQLDELNFSSSEIRTNTGNPAIDQLEKRIMGQMMDQLSSELENDSQFKAMSKKARAKFLKDYLHDIREEVREQGRAEEPELYDQMREEKKPRRDREFEQELNSPGLSKALQLGVPMTVPPRYPGEDDIAYRARLLQLSRQRRARLDGALGDLAGLSTTGQRTRLLESLYQ